MVLVAAVCCLGHVKNYDWLNDWRRRHRWCCCLDEAYRQRDSVSAVQSRRHQRQRTSDNSRLQQGTEFSQPVCIAVNHSISYIHTGALPGLRRRNGLKRTVLKMSTQTELGWTICAVKVRVSLVKCGTLWLEGRPGPGSLRTHLKYFFQLFTNI